MTAITKTYRPTRRQVSTGGSGDKENEVMKLVTQHLSAGRRGVGSLARNITSTPERLDGQEVFRSSDQVPGLSKERGRSEGSPEIASPESGCYRRHKSF
jgi:hypothetical protein